MGLATASSHTKPRASDTEEKTQRPQGDTLRRGFALQIYAGLSEEVEGVRQVNTTRGQVVRRFAHLADCQLPEPTSDFDSVQIPDF